MEVNEIEEHYARRKKYLLTYKGEMPRWYYKVLSQGLESWRKNELCTAKM